MSRNLIYALLSLEKTLRFVSILVACQDTGSFAKNHNPWAFIANFCINGTFTHSYKAALYITAWSRYARQLCEYSAMYLFQYRI